MLTGRGSWPKAAVAGASLALLAACGSTIEGPVGQAAGGDSLGVPSTVPTGAPYGGAPSATQGSGGSGEAGPTPAGSYQAAPGPGPSSTGTAGGPGTFPSPGRHGHGGVAGNKAANLVKGPLTIGFAYPDNSGANASLGVATATSDNPKNVMGAIISALNKRGGLDGRDVTVDYYASQSTTSNYSTSANAACAHFAEDAHVSVVLDLAFGNKFGMAGCLAKHDIADFGLGTSDAVNDNAAGLFASPDWLSSTRRYPAVLAGLHATGYLTSKNKIGVLVEQCADLNRAYQQAVVPEIRRLKLTLATTAGIGCTSGFASAGTASAAIAGSVLRFRSAGVDRVLIVSDFEQVALLWLANAAASQGWHPGYLLSSAAEPEVMMANIPKSQWPALHGVGWSPFLDTNGPHQPMSAVDEQCLRLIKEGGVMVTGVQNTYIAMTECSDVLFLQAALRASRGDAGGQALMAGVESLGTSFVSPGIVDGRTSFSPDRREGPDAVAPFGYVASCGCLEYTGRPATAP